LPSFTDVLLLSSAAKLLLHRGTRRETELQPYLEKYQQSCSIGGVAARAGVYEFPDGRKLQIAAGEIVSQQVDAIVSPDNSELTMSYGCPLLIRLAAGESVHDSAKGFAPALPGRVVVTSAGKLPSRFVFHAVTKGHLDGSIRPSRDIVNELISAIVYQAETLSVRSIAIPLLGTGGSDLEAEISLRAMFVSLARHLHRGIASIRDVRIILFPNETPLPSLDPMMPALGRAPIEPSSGLKPYQVGDQPVSGLGLVRVLGQGGMGTVWLARASNGREYALKVIELRAAGGRREYHVLSMLKKCGIRHENLLSLHGFWLKDSEGNLIPDQSDANVDDPTVAAAAKAERAKAAQLIVAMELGDKSLTERLDECTEKGEEGIPLGELMRYLQHAARGLDYLHSEGIIHRDVKPENITLVGDVAKISGNYLAVAIDTDLPRTSIAYTPYYAAPEVMDPDQGPQSGQADQYSLAVSFIELLVGRFPYTGASVQEVYLAKMTGEYDLSMIRSPAIRKVLERALAKDPRKRFATCVEFVQALAQAERTPSLAKSFWTAIRSVWRSG
jgi:O-acetyl-ADP-ribose deacetylase (regulator of RNase III)